MSHSAAQTFLACNSKEWNVVLVINRKEHATDDIVRAAKDIRVICFDDIDCPLNDYVMPSRKSIETVLNFTNNLDKVVFSCCNGISRSSALAYVSKCQCQPPEQAINIMRHNTHYPNKIVIKLASEILEYPKIYEVYQAWIKDYLPRFNTAWTNQSTLDFEGT